jgi:hypothetical protein
VAPALQARGHAGNRRLHEQWCRFNERKKYICHRLLGQLGQEARQRAPVEPVLPAAQRVLTGAEPELAGRPVAQPAVIRPELPRRRRD